MQLSRNFDFLKSSFMNRIWPNESYSNVSRVSDMIVSGTFAEQPLKIISYIGSGDSPGRENKGSNVYEHWRKWAYRSFVSAETLIILIMFGPRGNMGDLLVPDYTNFYFVFTLNQAMGSSSESGEMSKTALLSTSLHVWSTHRSIANLVSVWPVNTLTGRRPSTNGKDSTSPVRFT